MGWFINGYLTRTKKWEPSALNTDKGIELKLDVFDSLMLRLTPEQAKDIVRVLQNALSLTPQAKPGRTQTPPPRRDDDY